MHNFSELIERHYPIEKVITIEKHGGGCINDNYVVYTRDKRYFWRVYNAARCQQDIVFEHDLLRYLQQQQFKYISPLVYTNSQQTYVRYEGRYCALFVFLNDCVIYDWDEDCSMSHLNSAARLQANYHGVVDGWRPLHLRMTAWDVFFAKLRRKISEKHLYSKRLKPYYKQLLSQLEHVSCFMDSIAQTSLPEIVVHGDYHAGNIMFDEEKACAILDFDWCFFSYRIFDVALAIFYFCRSWVNHSLCRERYKLYLRNYEDVISLCHEEHKVLKDFLVVVRLYLLNWVLDAYDNLSQQQQCLYLEHLCYCDEDS